MRDLRGMVGVEEAMEHAEGADAGHLRLMGASGHAIRSGFSGSTLTAPVRHSGVD
jgi:hypothetical protein